MKKGLTIVLSLILVGASQLALAQEGTLKPPAERLSDAEKAAKQFFREATDKTPADKTQASAGGGGGGGGLLGGGGPPNLNANSPTLSPVPSRVQQIPPQPHGNPQNPWLDSSRKNPWADSSKNNPWARPPQPPVSSPVQPPAYAPVSPPPANIYLPPNQ